MTVKITYFVHGTTYDNEEHKASGWSNVKLSPKGIEQSFALKEKININEFDVVFCSDLDRAIDSANNIFGNQKEIIQDKRLRECDYGILSGKYNSLVIYEEHIEKSFPQGESMRDVEKRIKSFCDFLVKNYNEKHVAIVAHKAPQLALEVLTNGNTWEEAIETDWRKTKNWQPGWGYIIKGE